MKPLHYYHHYLKNTYNRQQENIKPQNTSRAYTSETNVHGSPNTWAISTKPLHHILFNQITDYNLQQLCCHISFFDESHRLSPRG